MYQVAKLYSDLRRESMSSGGVPIAVRHIEVLTVLLRLTALQNAPLHFTV
jgi:hypothetical protein